MTQSTEKYFYQRLHYDRAPVETDVKTIITGKISGAHKKFANAAQKECHELIGVYIYYKIGLADLAVASRPSFEICHASFQQCPPLPFLSY